MNIDLEKLSLKELKDLQSQVAKNIAGFEDRKKREAIAKLEEHAKSMGFALNELVSGAPVRKRAIVKAKYANPANKADTWTGRGRKPRWVQAALDAGKRIEELLIPSH